MDIPKRVGSFFHSSKYREAAETVQSGSVTVLHGLSGSGKTQICARLALDYQKEPANRVFCIKATTTDSLNKGINEISSKFHLNLDFDKKDLLAQLLGALSKSANVESETLVIVDDVVDEIIFEEVLKNLDDAVIQGQLKNISVIVTSQFQPRTGYRDNPGNHIIYVNGFSDEEAGEYLKIPENRLVEVLAGISCLPVALNPFKQAYHSFRLEDDQQYIDRYLRLVKESPEKNNALKSITICLNRAAAENSLLKDILKLLSMFSGENITIELLIGLAEEYHHSLGVDEADSIVDVLVKRSIGNIHVSDTERKYLTLHDLVKEAVNNLVKDEEKPKILRAALEAFSHIMPCDGRHHQSDVIPKLFKHALSLQKSYKKIAKSHTIDELTKLLYAELCMSIGYCMMSQRDDAKEVTKKLEEGKELFLNLLFQGSIFSDNFENEIEDSLKCESSRQRFMPVNDQYSIYIQSLQFKYRLSLRDLKTLFPEQEDKNLYKFKKSDHLSTIGLEILNARDDRSLLPVVELAVIYTLELFAQYLHLLSKSYGNLKNKEGKQESLRLSQKADVIYSSIKYHCGVSLLGMYINRRYLLNLQTELSCSEDLDILWSSWKDLREVKSGKVYERGIVRSLEMSEDDYHKLICLEGEMLVHGVIASKTDINGKKGRLAKGEELIQEIEKLCHKHHRPDITRSRAYIEVSKFYQLCTEFQKAISYSVKSMMENKAYWMERQRYKQNNLHPELDSDKINKFTTIYKQLESCVNSLKENKDALNRKIRLMDEKKYLEDVDKAWKEKQNSREEGGDKTFVAIDHVLEFLTQEATVCQPD